MRIRIVDGKGNFYSCRNIFIIILLGPAVFYNMISVAGRTKIEIKNEGQVYNSLYHPRPLNSSTPTHQYQILVKLI